MVKQRRTAGVVRKTLLVKRSGVDWIEFFWLCLPLPSCIMLNWKSPTICCVNTSSSKQFQSQLNMKGSEVIQRYSLGPLVSLRKTLCVTPWTPIWRKQEMRCLRNKKYKESIIKYSKAIKVNPANAVLYANRSAANLCLNHYTKALRDGLGPLSFNNHRLPSSLGHPQHESHRMENGSNWMTQRISFGMTTIYIGF